MKKHNIYIIIFIILSIFILFQRLLYSSNTVSRLKEKFYMVIEPGSKDITVLQNNVKGETNVYRPNIYYNFQQEKKFDLDNYF
jgi:hypothetical protein